MITILILGLIAIAVSAIAIRQHRQIGVLRGKYDYAVDTAADYLNAKKAAEKELATLRASIVEIKDVCPRTPAPTKKKAFQRGWLRLQNEAFAAKALKSTARGDNDTVTLRFIRNE